MAFFTDSPYEYMMTQKPGAERREIAPPLYPPGHKCHGCPYGRDRLCLGVCIKELSTAVRRKEERAK